MKILLIALLLTSSSVFAESKREKREMMMMNDMTAQQHQDMATIHQKMSDCLKSTTSKDTCQTDMVDSCKKMMGEKNCHMAKMKNDM